MTRKIEEFEITNITDLWSMIVASGPKGSTVKFVKKNGADRLMRCTLDFKFIPKEFHPKGEMDSNSPEPGASNVLNVFDLDVGGWRSISFNRAEWIQMSDGRIINIKPWGMIGGQ